MSKGLGIDAARYARIFGDEDARRAANAEADRREMERRRRIWAERANVRPAPYVIGDRVEYRSILTGEMITGRRQHRDHLRAHNCVELGNDRPPPRDTKKEINARMDASIHSDIKTAFEQVEAGWIPPEGPPDPPELTPDSISVSDSGLIRAA